MATLHAAFPRLPLHSRVIIEALVLTGGSLSSTSPLAATLRLPNRYALTRLLHRAGLPSLRELSAWVSVLSWVIKGEATGLPLFVIAKQARRVPAVCYRLVKRTTGLTWTALRARGSPWVMDRFVRRCPRPQR